MKINPVTWFREVWPTQAKRHTVIEGYRGIGKMVLTDIALRGYVFSAPPRTPGDVFRDGINEGRRLLAQEILDLAALDPATLHDLIEKKPTEQERKR